MIAKQGTVNDIKLLVENYLISRHPTDNSAPAVSEEQLDLLSDLILVDKETGYRKYNRAHIHFDNEKDKFSFLSILAAWFFFVDEKKI